MSKPIEYETLIELIRYLPSRGIGYNGRVGVMEALFRAEKLEKVAEAAKEARHCIGVDCTNCQYKGECTEHVLDKALKELDDE